MSLKLKPNEDLYLVIRRYGLTFFWSWLLILILLIVPFFFLFWLFQNGWWGISLFFLSLSLALLLLMRTVFFWQKNAMYFTNSRVVDLDQRGLFDKIVTELMYDQIEDVSGRVRGMWGTIFNYGEFRVQSGNGQVKIVATKIKRPLELQSMFNQWRQNYLNQSARDFSGVAEQAIIDKLYELNTLELQRVKDVVDRLVSKQMRL